jgi:protein-tyrosine phosphatase
MTGDRPPSPIDWVDLSGVPSLGPSTGGRPGRLGMCGLARAVTIDESDGVDMLVVLVDAPATFEELPPRTLVIRHPIVDMGVPADRAGFGDLVDSIVSSVRGGRSIVVCCLAGYGRTGTAVACALVHAGVAAEHAIELVRATRPGTIETEEQEAYVRSVG